MTFEIGDRVNVKGFRNKSAEIVDKLYSEVSKAYRYQILFDGSETPSNTNLSEDSLELIKDEVDTKLDYEFEFLDNVVIAILYEIKGDEKTEIARGHGHIIHENTLGKAQAASYALKKIYEKLGGEF